MASIPNLDLTEAMQVTVVATGGDAAPQVMTSSGDEGAGLSVALILSATDALDVNGQLAGRGWRILAAYHVPGDAARDVYTWVRT